MAKLGDAEKRVICIAKDHDHIVAMVRRGTVKITARSKSCCEAVGKLFLAHGDKFGILIDVVERTDCSTVTIRGRNQITGRGNCRNEAVGRMVKEYASQLGFKIEYDNGSFKECN